MSVPAARYDDDVEGSIEKMQQNSRCRLCDDRDETTNHIISECSKLAQFECKTRHDWLGNVIHMGNKIHSKLGILRYKWTT